MTRNESAFLRKRCAYRESNENIDWDGFDKWYGANKWTTGNHRAIFDEAMRTRYRPRKSWMGAIKKDMVVVSTTKMASNRIWKKRIHVVDPRILQYWLHYYGSGCWR